jgi:ADP-ribose pyrophosphatase
LWELPAGRLDPGDSPLAAARRELAEETGYRARRWKRLASFYPSPGYTSERMTLYLAENLVEGAARPEHDESIRCRWFAPRQLLRMIRDGRLQDAKTLVGLLWLLRK